MLVCKLVEIKLGEKDRELAKKCFQVKWKKKDETVKLRLLARHQERLKVKSEVWEKKKWEKTTTRGKKKKFFKNITVSNLCVFSSSCANSRWPEGGNESGSVKR